MARRPRKQASRSQPGQAWLWWQVEVGRGTPQPVGRTRGTLSPHVLNLRAELVAEPRAAQALPALPAAQRETIDFAGHLRPTLASFVPPPLPQLLGQKRTLGQLTITGWLDVPWCVAGSVVTLVVFGYVVLAHELAPIVRAVGDDVRTYLRAVRLTLTAPLRLYAAPPLAIPVTAGQQPGSRRYTFHSVAWFGLVGLLVVAPLKGLATLNQVNAHQAFVVTQARQGVAELRQAGNLLAKGNTAEAEQGFSQASERFAAAWQRLNQSSARFVAAAGTLPGAGSRLASAGRLLAASREAALAAAGLTAAWQIAGSSEPLPVGERLAALEAAVLEAGPHLRQAAAELRGVEPFALPPGLAPALAQFLAELDDVERTITRAFELPSFLRQLAGVGEPKRYLMLFQNPSELRPTGGFAGSLAFVELYQGAVVDLEVPGGGPYDFQGSLARTIAPPEPIRISRGTWQLQDANWFFDFPTSARKVLWFLRESGGPEVDGVVAVTADVAAQLVGLTGSIELPQYRKTLTAENFVRETQAAVELEFDPVANRPKQFIADLAPELLSRVLALDRRQHLELVQLLEQALAQRSIMLYLTDPELQARARSLGWAGEVQGVPFDYLAIVRTNVGGGKTDAVTDELVEHEVEVLPSGELVARVSLTRHHRGDPRDVFEWRRNQDYVRFYVPQGAQLIAASGFTPPPADHLRPVPEEAEADADLGEVERGATTDPLTGVRTTTEFGKTVFGHWLNVMPGERRTATISYRLPLSLPSSSSWQDLRRYTVYFQRQAGVRPLEFRSRLVLPPGWRVRWQEARGATLSAGGRTVAATTDWQQDFSYGVVLERTVAVGQGS